MKKAIFAMVPMAISLIIVGTPARAEIITYACSEPDDPGAPMIIRVNTKTLAATDTDPGEAPVNGTAQITDSNLSVTVNSGRDWTIQINRSTGESVDSDGSSGSCQLVQ
jgi:hypothetical protein